MGRHACSVIAYLPPACNCLSEAINSCSLFSKSPEGTKVSLTLEESLPLGIFKLEAPLEGMLPTCLAGGEFEIQEVNSPVQGHTGLD